MTSTNQYGLRCRRAAALAVASIWLVLAPVATAQMFSPQLVKDYILGEGKQETAAADQEDREAISLTAPVTMGSVPLLSLVRLEPT